MIQFVNLRKEFMVHRKELMHAITRVVQSGTYLLGPELREFEREFAEFVGSSHVVGVGSGTEALTLSIRALGFGPGDEVIVPANAYPTVFGVAMSGVTVRLCDVDPKTLLVTNGTILSALRKSTRAIVVVHLYGMPVGMNEILELAKAKKLLVIEDCAQAVGATIGDRHVGTFGDAAIFSFYPTKNLAALGDGGAVTTDSTDLADRIKRLRMYGEEKRYQSTEVSNHSRLEEVQAAILRVRLGNLEESLRLRHQVAQRYRRYLPKDIQIPAVMPTGITHANHLFVVRSKNRDRLRQRLTNEGIETGIHYPYPLHFLPPFARCRKTKYKPGSFPVAEQAAAEILSLPMYPSLSLDDQDEVIEIVSKWK